MKLGLAFGKCPQHLLNGNINNRTLTKVSSSSNNLKQLGEDINQCCCWQVCVFYSDCKTRNPNIAIAISVSSNCPKFTRICPFLFKPHAYHVFLKYALLLIFLSGSTVRCTEGIHQRITIDWAKIKRLSH